MSGFEQAEPQEELKRLLAARDPACAAAYSVMNDTVGAIFMASPEGARATHACPRVLLSYLIGGAAAAAGACLC